MHKFETTNTMLLRNTLFVRRSSLMFEIHVHEEVLSGKTACHHLPWMYTCRSKDVCICTGYGYRWVVLGFMVLFQLSMMGKWFRTYTSGCWTCSCVFIDRMDSSTSLFLFWSTTNMSTTREAIWEVRFFIICGGIGFRWEHMCSWLLIVNLLHP